MDSRGNIFHDVPPEEVAKRGLVEIPREELEVVNGMNRRQRRAWFARKRTAARKKVSE